MHNTYKSEDYKKKFCESLREQPIKIINFEKKKNVPFTNEQAELNEKTEICHICKKCLYISTLKSQ